MKSLLLFFAINAFLIAGCSNNKVNKMEENIEFDYSDVSNKMIEWNILFSIDKDSYYCYIYSPKCGHCNDIKQEVISFALRHDNFYFTLFNSDITVGDDIQSSIGATNVEEIVILGTPTLLIINNHVLTDNIAGSSVILKTLTNV